VFYTIQYVCGLLLLWPLFLPVLLYVLVRDGPQLCWGFLRSHYDGCLFGD
jgi:hypothetical protein